MAEYLLAGSEELNRLQLQARVWEAETEALLEQIGIQPGWTCLDLGCGAMGILGALSRAVKPKGKVLGIDQDVSLLAAAQIYVESEKFDNVTLYEGDVHHSGLPREGFDLVHERFVLPHVVSPEKLIQEMIALAKPGGIIVLQEPDHSSWRFHPSCESWPRFLEILETALGLRGDINIGRLTYQILKTAGLEDVHLRAGVLGLESQHPYMQMPLIGMTAMKERILMESISTEEELDRLAADVLMCCNDQERMMISFTTTQTWGRKPM